MTPNDCGAYRAVATNELGKSIANTAVVVTRTYLTTNCINVLDQSEIFKIILFFTEAPKKPSFIKKLDDITVVEGKPIKLEVQIDGFPQPTIKW